jgi:hypothetical protein
MKTCPYPLQALALGATGMTARCFLAVAAIMLGGALATFPEVYAENGLMFLLFPVSVFYLTTLPGLLMFCTLGAAWASFFSFVRFNGGKWSLFLIFAFTLYGVHFEDLLGMDEQYFWRTHHWPLLLPLLAGLILGTPDLINRWRGRSGSESSRPCPPVRPAVESAAPDRSSMVTCPDDLQAVLLGLSGLFTRSLLAAATLIASALLACWPHGYWYNILIVLLFPGWIFLLTDGFGLLAIVCLATAWISFYAFVRFNSGKWTLFTLLASSLYGTALAVYCDNRSQWPVLGYYQFHFQIWPFLLPLVIAWIIGQPDLKRFRDRSVDGIAAALTALAEDRPVTARALRPFPDPFQKLVEQATGKLDRPMLAVAVLTAGGSLTTFPAVDWSNPFVILLMSPARYLSGWAGVLTCWCAIVLVGALVVFFRAGGGKCTLFVLFSASLYFGVFGNQMDRTFYWSEFWMDYQWAVLIPPVVGLLLAIPDVINHQLQAMARRRLLEKTGWSIGQS